MISYVNQVCIEVEAIGEELDQYNAYSSFMAERWGDLDDDAVAHASNVGNRNRTLEKTGCNLIYANQPEWI